MTTSTGKTALITGVGSGLGLQLARCFAQDGHDLVLVGHSEPELDAIARDLSQAHGVVATPIAKDLFVANAAWELYDEVKARGIVVSDLVIEAGQGARGSFVETDIEEALQIVQLNVCAPLVLAKLFLRDMLAVNHGHILLATPAGDAGAQCDAVHGSTGAFLRHFTGTLSRELQGTGVTVTTLQPDGSATTNRADDAVGWPNKLADVGGAFLPETLVAARQKKKSQQPRH